MREYNYHLCYREQSILEGPASSAENSKDWAYKAHSETYPSFGTHLGMQIGVNQDLTDSNPAAQRAGRRAESGRARVPRRGRRRGPPIRLLRRPAWAGP